MWICQKKKKKKATNPPHVLLKTNNKILFIFYKENIEQNIKIKKLGSQPPRTMPPLGAG
jgi:hypothetical protein